MGSRCVTVGGGSGEESNLAALRSPHCVKIESSRAARCGARWWCGAANDSRGGAAVNVASSQAVSHSSKQQIPHRTARDTSINLLQNNNYLLCILQFMADRIAEVHGVPGPRIVALEHPGIVRNFDNGLKSLGSEAQLKHVSIAFEWTAPTIVGVS